MINVVFILLAKGPSSDFIEDVSSKRLLLALLACSRPFFHDRNVIGLWLMTFTISRKIRKTVSFYPQLRYFHVL